MENTETIYKVGDKVWSPAFGWGEVVKTDNESNYCIGVEFDRVGFDWYTADGRLYSDCPICLFFTEQQYSVERPAWQPKQGEWCWFWDRDSDGRAILGRFDMMTTEGKYKREFGFSFKNCAPFTGELPPHLKE